MNSKLLYFWPFRYLVKLFENFHGVFNENIFVNISGKNSHLYLNIGLAGGGG
jgi:hypothetical protein